MTAFRYVEENKLEKNATHAFSNKVPSDKGSLRKHINHGPGSVHGL